MYETRELKNFIGSVCEKNISRASKEMALSHIASLEAKLKIHREVGDEAEMELLQLQSKGTKMTPDQIKNLRALLIEAKETLEFSITRNSDGQVLCLENINQALALLPCPTCNDRYKQIAGGSPCPDCQS